MTGQRAIEQWQDKKDHDDLMTRRQNNFQKTNNSIE